MEIVADTYLFEKSIPMFSNNNNSDTERNVGNRELNRVIENAVENIPMDYRLVFTLRELNGLCSGNCKSIKYYRNKCEGKINQDKDYA